MPQPNEFLATVLQRGGSAFAGFAAAEMLEAQRESAGSQPDSLEPWKAWLDARVVDLAAAVSAGKPELFAEQVRWAGSLFAARSVPVEAMERALLISL